MSRRFWLLLMAASMATSGAMAGEPAGPPRQATAKSIAEQAARLVADLGSDDYTTREGAARDLQTLGPAAMPLLRTAVTSRDPEVRRLARQVAEKLAQQMEAAQALEPRRLRVAYRDVPLHVAVQGFQQATGVRIQLEGAKADRKVTFDTGYTTFWDAFDKFCTATGLTETVYDAQPDAGMNEMFAPQWGRRWNRWNGEFVQQDETMPALLNGQFVLTEAKTKPAPRPTFQAGAIRFRALPAGTFLGRVSTFKGDREVIFGLEVLPDPALAWERVQSLHIERAVDEQGQSLEVTSVSVGTAPSFGDEEVALWGGDWMGPAPTVNNGGQRMPLRLRMGRKPSTVLKELSGVATIKMQSGTETLAAIDRILETRDRSTRAKDGSLLKIVDLQREEGGKLTLHVKVEQAHPEAAANPWGFVGGMAWRGMNDGTEATDSSVSTGNLVLFDARGHLVRLVGKEQIPDENGVNEEYKFTYQLAKGQPDPTKLVLQGRRPLSIHVPFTLKDVPLKAAPGAAKSVPPPKGAGTPPTSEISSDW